MLEFPDRLPNGRVALCANCHVDPRGGGERNQFGEDFDLNGQVWGAALAMLDSDGDGFTNGEELQDPDGGWTQSEAQPGDVSLVSAAGWAFSTPGENALRFEEVIFEPQGGEQGDHQAVLLRNLSAIPVDVAGLWIHSGADFYSFPNGQSSKTTIPAGGRLALFLNDATNANLSGLISEPAAGGITALQASSGFLALHWIADFELTFELPQTMVDYVQWGEAGQDREITAVADQQWQLNTFVPSPAPGTSMRRVGLGEGAGAWVSNVIPRIPVYLRDVLLHLTGRIVLDPTGPQDLNDDNAIDAGDVVTFINGDN
jgi:hypothetical protein